MIGIIHRGYTLHIANFEGPLDLLLELIQENKLQITEVSLSAVTDQYLSYLRTMQLFNIDIASEFFVVAATLVYLKTKYLLPKISTEDEEEPLTETELLARLREYKKFRYLARQLEKIAEEGDIYYSRGYIPDPIEGKSHRVRIQHTLYVGDLLQSLYRYKGAFIRKPIPIKRREVRVEEKMEKILQKVYQEKMIRFSQIASEEPTKVDRVASFLGGLELSFRQKVLLKQVKIFTDIYIHLREQQGVEV